MTLPGFDSARVPALFSCVEIVCFSALAAFAVCRIWPTPTRSSAWAIAVVSLAIVLDGWASVPVVPAPRPLPVQVAADLVVELPTRGFEEDVAAMYRGMTHGRPLVNGYSGWVPPHYVQVQADLRTDCVKSLEGLRGGRSMDAVIWRGQSSAVWTPGCESCGVTRRARKQPTSLSIASPAPPPRPIRKKCDAVLLTAHPDAVYASLPRSPIHSSTHDAIVVGMMSSNRPARMGVWIPVGATPGVDAGPGMSSTAAATPRATPDQTEM